jgi:hypothetical protein
MDMHFYSMISVRRGGLEPPQAFGLPDPKFGFLPQKHGELGSKASSDRLVRLELTRRQRRPPTRTRNARFRAAAVLVGVFQ